MTGHIVDTLIEERAGRLMRRPLVWKAVQRLLYPVLGYDKAIHMVNLLRDAGGREVFDWLSDRLRMQVSCEGLEHLPATGRAVILANHPAGIADGIAVYDALKEKRPDMVFFANRDAIRAVPRLNEMIIPVEWMEHRRDHARNKETVRGMVQAMRDERLIVIFPSGRLARPTLRGLVERDWMSSGVSIAQKYGCPIVPMHVRGTNSWLFYLLWFVNTELKDMTLFRELLNKTDQRYHLRLAPTLRATGDADELTRRIRQFVTGPLSRGSATFSQP
ncbi:MAG: 1-acyl-sn-glycerol-3-phosphate acyltransferase [Pseudomonadales bacterium]|nr:1-acyl-sn-glycerol-3-phosphate acyltransferase [Pseudomonadales bacterium]MCP5182995.1 1-acyl-sn-glycerol-3-phosphate acyltransferase [Pseudomonadales bacterium]